MIEPTDILRDKDVAKIAGMAYLTFQRKMRDGFVVGELDWNAAQPVKNGRERVWLRRDVERVWKERIMVKAPEAAAAEAGRTD